LLISSKDYKDWPYDARLALKCNYQQNQALVILEIQNSGTSSFSWTGGLHPYFAFDLLNTEVHGLYAASQQYLYRPSEYFQGKPSLRFDRNAYECLFNTNNSLHVTTPTRTLTLSMEGFDQWMIWNPGEEGAKALNDLPNEDWCQFLCIEPVVLSNPVILKPHESWIGSLRIKIDQA